MESVGLLRTLVAAGLGSRRKIASAIREGRLKVNGIPATAFSHAVDINKDEVTWDGVKVELQAEPKIYLALNKPAGVLSTTSDERNRKTVMDFIPSHLKGVKIYPVGRLDRQSTGLVLLTNDGELAYRLTHPRFEHEKEYLVHLDHALEEDDLALLSRGVELNDGITRPARITLDRKKGIHAYIVIIHEGKNHIVRRMFASLGYLVLKLNRTRISCVKLGKLNPGETRLLTPEEISLLQGF